MGDYPATWRRGSLGYSYPPSSTLPIPANTNISSQAEAYTDAVLDNLALDEEMGWDPDLDNWDPRHNRDVQDLLNQNQSRPDTTRRTTPDLPGNDSQQRRARPKPFGRKRPPSFVPAMRGAPGYSALVRAGARLLPIVGAAATAYEVYQTLKDVLVETRVYNPGDPFPWDDGSPNFQHYSWPPEGYFNEYAGTKIRDGYVPGLVTAPRDDPAAVIEPALTSPADHRFMQDGSLSRWEEFTPVEPGVQPWRSAESWIWNGAGEPEWQGGTDVQIVPTPFPAIVPGGADVPAPRYRDLPDIVPDPLAPPGHRRETGPGKHEFPTPAPAPTFPPWEVPLITPPTIVVVPAPGTQPRPAPRPGTRPGTRPNPRPRPEWSPPVRPAPRPKPRPEPGPGVGPDPNPEPGSGPGTLPKPSPAPKPRHRYQPPRRDEKEKKVRWRRLWAGAHIINPITEGIDFVEALFEALPPECKPGWYKLHKKGGGTFWKKRRQASPQEMVEALWNCWDHIDGTQAVYNLAWEQIEDWIFGTAGRMLKKSTNPWLEFSERPVGFGSGPAL